MPQASSESCLTFQRLPALLSQNIGGGGAAELGITPAAAGQLVRGDGSGVNMPTKLPNPSGIEILLNGSSQGSYDGATAKAVNITPDAIGAHRKGHPALIMDTIFAGNISGNHNGQAFINIYGGSFYGYKLIVIKGGIGWSNHVENGQFVYIGAVPSVGNIAISPQGVLSNVGFDISQEMIRLQYIKMSNASLTPFYEITSIYGLR